MFSILILMQVSAPAQVSWSFVDDEKLHNKSSALDGSLFRDSILLICSEYSTASCPSTELAAFNLRGDRLWTHDGSHNTVLVNGNHIYTAGYSGMDDVAGNDQLVLSKFNENGEEVFSVGFPEVPHEEWIPFIPNSMVMTDQGMLIICSDNGIIMADTAGNVLVEKLLGQDQSFHSIRTLPGGSVLVCGAGRLHHYDASFAPVDSFDFGEDCKTIIATDTLIYCLLTHQLVTLDTNLNVTDTLYAVEEFNLEGLRKKGEELWLQGMEEDSIHLIGLREGAVFYSKTFGKVLKVNDFLVAADHVVLYGSTYSDQAGLFSKSLEEDDPGNDMPDLELVDFDIDSVKIEYVIDGQDTLAETGYWFNVKMQIENKGTETINSLAVFSDLLGGFNCGQNFYYQKFSDLEILPGQTVEYRPQTRIFQEYTGQSTLCFECLSPNSQPEVNVSDNTLCKTFRISGIHETSGPVFSVHPNPTAGLFFISTNTPGLKSITIRSINGSVVYENTTAGSDVLIDLSDAHAGMYFISVKSANATYTGKILRR